MKERFSAQDLIDIGVELYDNQHFGRYEVYEVLKILKNNDKVENDVNIDFVFDMIVG